MVNYPLILLKYNKYLKEIIKILADKYFPEEWDYFNLFIQKYFTINIEDLLSYNKIDNTVYTNIELVDIAASFFYSVLKQHSGKKTHFAKSKYYKNKEKFNELIINIFQS